MEKYPKYHFISDIHFYDLFYTIVFKVNKMSGENPLFLFIFCIFIELIFYINYHLTNMFKFLLYIVLLYM